MLHSDPGNKAEPEENELWAMSVMERTVDAVRFRVDGLRPDVMQERPAGFSQSMADILSVLRRGEEDFNAVLRAAMKAAKPSAKTTFTDYPRAFVDRPFDEMGAFLKARERSLGVLRTMSQKQWDSTINDPERGQRTIEELAVERARNDRRQLDLLEGMRAALLTSVRPAERTIQGSKQPDSTR
jgi:hypothetical protein